MTTSNQSSTQLSPRQRLPNVQLLLLGIFSFLGFADAAYITASHYLTLPVPCSLAGGCETVLTSQYSTLFGIPIALFGAAYYIVVLCLFVYLYTSFDQKKWAVWAVFGITGAAFITSCYLFYLQAAVIHAYCQYCLGSAITTTILFIVSSMLVRSLRKAQ